MKKFAFKKYRREFLETFETVWASLSDLSPGDTATLAKLEEVKRIAELRFNS